MREFTMELLQAQSLRPPRRRLCANLRSRKAHGHLTRSILRENSREKCHALELSPTFCAGLRGRKAHGHLTRRILCQNSQGKSAPQKLAPCFVRPCAVDIHMDMWQEPFYTRIITENAAPQELAKLMPQTLCEPAQSKCAWTSHKSILRESLQEKCWGADGAPWSSNGLYAWTPQCGRAAWGKTLTRTATTFLCKDPDENLRRSSLDLLEEGTRSLIPEPLRSIPQEFSYKHL